MHTINRQRNRKFRAGQRFGENLAVIERQSDANLRLILPVHIDFHQAMRLFVRRTNRGLHIGGRGRDFGQQKAELTPFAIGHAIGLEQAHEDITAVKVIGEKVGVGKGRDDERRRRRERELRLAGAFGRAVDEKAVAPLRQRIGIIAHRRQTRLDIAQNRRAALPIERRRRRSAHPHAKRRVDLQPDIHQLRRQFRDFGFGPSLFIISHFAPKVRDFLPQFSPIRAQNARPRATGKASPMNGEDFLVARGNLPRSSGKPDLPRGEAFPNAKVRVPDEEVGLPWRSGKPFPHTGDEGIARWGRGK